MYGMNSIAKFAKHLRHYKRPSVKGLPKNPKSGAYDVRRLRNKNGHYRTTYYRSAKKLGYKADHLVQYLVENDRIRADPETGTVETRRTSTGKWKKIRVRYDSNSREMVALYAKLDGIYLRINTTLGKIAYLVYHGAGSIPPDHDVDHVDEDITNNKKSNLVPLHRSINRSRFAHQEPDNDDNPF